MAKLCQSYEGCGRHPETINFQRVVDNEWLNINILDESFDKSSNHIYISDNVHVVMRELADSLSYNT